VATVVLWVLSNYKLYGVAWERRNRFEIMAYAPRDDVSFIISTNSVANTYPSDGWHFDTDVPLPPITDQYRHERILIFETSGFAVTYTPKDNGSFCHVFIPCWAIVLGSPARTALGFPATECGPNGSTTRF